MEIKQAVYVKYNFTPGVTVIESMYTWFRAIAVGRGYSERVSGETPEAYMKKVVAALGSKDAMVVLDLNRPTDKNWADGFTDQVRTLWELGINVVVTTSEDLDVIESKNDQRRTLLLFGELPLSHAVKYVRSLTLERPIPPDMTDVQLEALLMHQPRDFVHLSDWAKRQVTDWRSEALKIPELQTWYQQMVRGALGQARCHEATAKEMNSKQLTTPFEVLNKLLQGPVEEFEITKSCSNSAVETLLRRNVIRHVAVAGSVNRHLFAPCNMTATAAPSTRRTRVGRAPPRGATTERWWVPK
jgi:hypothetical protein